MMSKYRSPVKYFIKECFLDSKKVIRAADRARYKSLTRAGGIVRTIARRSMKKVARLKRANKKKGLKAGDWNTGSYYSRPGKPPHSHAGQLKKFLYFGYDRTTESVVIGPVGFAKSKTPAVLEYGGTVDAWGDQVIRWKTKNGKHVPVRNRKKAKISARPYMGPALNKAVDTNRAVSIWKNSLKGT